MQNLNSGIGYPRLTTNIGVTFSNGSPNPNSGHWLDINYSGVLGTGLCGVDQSFDLSSEEEVAGSYFPTSLIQKDNKPLFWGWEKITIYSSPTFIPYTSSLDLMNSTSKFDTVIQSSSNHFHDEFPPEVINPLLRILMPQCNLTIKHQILESGVIVTEPIKTTCEYFSYAIVVPSSISDGNGLNDVFIVGAFGEFLHWNGASWKSFIGQTGLVDGCYTSIAVKRDEVIAVGLTSSRAVIAVGKR